MGRKRSFDKTEVALSVARLVLERGYDAVGLDDIQRVTGLGRGSVYQAYGSKANLISDAIYALVTQGGVEADQMVAVVLGSSGANDPAIAASIRCHLTGFGSTEELERSLGAALLTRFDTNLELTTTPTNKLQRS